LTFRMIRSNKNMIEQSDTINPQSLEGVGHYGPSGPEAKIQNLKLTQHANLTKKWDES